jgi:hypothetical protein
MNRVIICSPYAGDTERNAAYARRAMRHSFDRGEAPFASHLLYPQILDDTNPRERAQGIQAAFEWICNCDLVAFYVDLGWSAGMMQELKCARLYHRRMEVRCLDNPVRQTPIGSKVAEGLIEAGIIEEESPPMPGVRAFRFRRDP